MLFKEVSTGRHVPHDRSLKFFGHKERARKTCVADLFRLDPFNLLINMTNNKQIKIFLHVRHDLTRLNAAVQSSILGNRRHFVTDPSLQWTGSHFRSNLTINKIKLSCSNRFQFTLDAYIAMFAAVATIWLLLLPLHSRVPPPSSRVPLPSRNLWAFSVQTSS